MKRLSFLFLFICCLSLNGWAQGSVTHFTLAHEGESGTHKTTIYVKLNLGDDDSGGDPTGGGSYWDSPREYEVAAFIGDECYATSRGTEPNLDYGDRDLYYNWFPLTVYSYDSSDRSENLTFKMFNHNTGVEYNLTCGGSYRIIGLNYGSTTNPVELSAIEPYSMSLDFEMTAGSTQSLDSKLSLLPEEATVPNNLYWEIFSPNGISSDYKLDGNLFTPYVTGTYEVYGWAGDYNAFYFRDGNITVKRAVNYVVNLAINEGYETLFVPEDDVYMLGDELARALNITWAAPYEIGDEYPEWVSSDKSVVGFDGTGRPIPVGKGSCTLTAQVYNQDSSVRLSASLTVKVGTFVTYINVLHSNLECMVGDDLTEYLPRTFEIQPSDADDKTVTYNITGGDGVLEKRDDGHIVAVGEGLASIRITANDGAGTSAGLTVSVQNVKNTISIKEKTLNIVNKNNVWPKDISSQVSGNVSFLPDDGYFGIDEPSFISGNTDVVTIKQIISAGGISELNASAIKAGTSRITVSLEVPNLLEQSLAGVGEAVDPIVVTDSFNINIAQELISIAFDMRGYNMNVGETLDFTDEIYGYPDGELDKSKLTLSVDEDYKDHVLIDGLKVKALLPTAPSDIVLTASLEEKGLTTTTDLTIYSPATAINVNSGYDIIEVYVGETEKLMDALKKAIAVTPANTTSTYGWEMSDPEIVGYDSKTDTFTPLKGGTTKATATVNDDSSLKAELTIRVLTRAASMYFDGRYYTLNVGDTIDFTDELKVSPAGAVFDKSKVTLSVEEDYKDYVLIDGLKVKALLPTAPKEIGLTATLAGSDLTAYTDISIFSPATAISVNSGYEIIEVYVGETEKLMDALNKAITVTPANTTSTYGWEMSDPEIVGYDSKTDTFTPLKGGTTKATATVNDDSSLKADLTVKVLMRAASMYFDGRYYTLNVGDTIDFTDELKVSPAGAVFDKSKVTLSVEEDYKDYVLIDGLKVKALLPTAPKEIGLTATLAGSDLTANTDISIFSPATAISVNSGYDTIVVYVGEDDRLTELLGKAVRIEPENTTSTISWIFSNEEIVVFDDMSQKFRPLKGGVTKLTVSADDNPKLKAELFVKVIPDAEKITLPERLIVNYSDTLDLTTVLTVEPEGSRLDYSKLVWRHSKTAGEYFNIEGNILKPLKPGMYAFGLEATVPDTDLKAESEVYIENPAKGLSVREGYSTVTVHVYEDEALTTMIKEAFVVDPENCTDRLVVTIDDDDIIFADPYRQGNYISLKPGSTTVTATIYGYFDEEHSSPLFEKSITVEVIPAVNDISVRHKTVMNEGETLNLDDIVELTLDPNQNYHKANLIWTIEKGKESLVSIDEDRVLTALKKGVLKLTASVPDTDIKDSTELTILRPATEMSVVSGFETVYVSVGTKWLPSILEDGLLVLPLGHTDSVAWALTDDGILEYVDGVLTPVKAGTTTVHAYIGDKNSPRLQTQDVTVEVGLRITGVEAKEPLLNYCNDIFTRRKPITQTVKDNFILTPEANLIDYNPRFVSSNTKAVFIDDIGTPDDDGVRPMYISEGTGTSTVTVTITVPDYNNPLSRNGKPGTRNLSASFDIEVEQGLQELEFDNVVMGVGDKYEMKLRTVPENVKFDFEPSKMKLAIEPNDGRDFPDDWTFVTWRQSDDDSLTFYLDAKCVGKGYIWAIYDDVTLAGGGAPNLQVTPRYTVGDGWQWFAMYDGVLENLQDIKDAFGNKLVEIRGRDGILFNDTDLGYIGDLNKITKGETYKLCMKDVPDEGYSFSIAPDQYASIFTGTTVEMKAGWNWMGNPYQYCQPVSKVFKGNTFTQGDILCSMDAYAVWDGSQWVGNLTHLTPGQGLMLMLNKAGSVKLNSETSMDQVLTAPAEHSGTCPTATVGTGMDRFHYSTVYYISVKDAKGKSMGNDMTEECIKAYVGDELRGISKRWSTDEETGETVFVVRVWGQNGDAGQVSFCAYYGEEGKEVGYHLGIYDFHGGTDESVGTPGMPVAMTLIPIDGLAIVPSVIAVKDDETTTVTTRLLPENHNEIEEPHTELLDANLLVWFTSSNPDIFTVGQSDGVITGVSVGESQLNATLYYVTEKNGVPLLIDLIRTFASVTVTSSDIPVSSIRNDMATTQLQRELGTDFMLAFTVLPEYATNRNVHYEVGNAEIISCTTDDHGDATFRGIKTGRTTITVISDFDPNVKLTYMVEIVYGSSDGHVIAVVPENDVIEALVGDVINSQLLYTIYPDNAIDKSVKLKVVNGKDGSVLNKLSNGDIEAVTDGESQVQIISNENSSISTFITVRVYEPQEATVITIPDDLTLSKVEDVMMHLKLTPSNATIDPDKLEFSIGQSKHLGWGEAATVVSADNTGRNWRFTGRYVGDYTYSVTYDGKEIKTDKGRSKGTLHIPADYLLEDGWHWMSLYAVPSSGSIALRQGDQWIDALTAGENSRVCEIRTQDEYMHYDWKFGYFGTLSELRPTDGCFKIYVYNDIREGQKMALSAGSSNLIMASDLTMPPVEKGFNWVTYPHEFNHTLANLAEWLNNSASEGDRIISSNGFIEYADGKWLGDNDFMFESGRGYIYYTEDDTPKTIDWGPAGLQPEHAASRSVCRVSRPSVSSETMPVVLSMDDDQSDLTVAAMVGDECRGIARPATDGLLHLSVAGCSGETVNLLLMNKFTGEIVGNATTVDFGARAGTHREPLQVKTRNLSPQVNRSQDTYDLQGRRVDSPVFNGISIMNGKKYVK